MLHRKNHNLLLFSLAILMLLTALEANAQVLDTINDSYKSATGGWLSNILPIAKSLFWKLAAIEFAWSAIVWALQQENMQSFTAVVVKKIMGIGFFYALLLNAGDWIPAIINSFTKAGQTASGASGLSPSSVIDMGINAANVLLNALHDKSIWDDFMTIVIGGLSALGIVLAFTIIAGQLLVALVESYIVISAGVLFLGFGGSRWTTDFTQKYLSYAVGTGVKLFMLYLIIGLGMTEAENWKTLLATAKYVEMLSVLGGSLVLCFLAFQIPNMAASMLSGAPSLTAGAAAGTAAAVAAGTVAAGGAVISPAMQSARGGVQALKAGYDHHRAAGSGMLASAVKAVGTSTVDYGREAARSGGEAVGLATPTQSKSGTIGGRAAETRRDATDAMREQQAAGGSAASGSQVPPPAQTSATSNSASNTSAPTGNKMVGSAIDAAMDGAAGGSAAGGGTSGSAAVGGGAAADAAAGGIAAGVVAAATREASDTMVDNAPQKLGSAAAQSTATNTAASNTSATNTSVKPPTTDAADATWNSDPSEVRAAGGGVATSPPQSQTRQASDTMVDNTPKKMGSAAPQATARNTSATNTSATDKGEKPFFDPHQVRPPQIPNDAAPQASVNIRLNHDE